MKLREQPTIILAQKSSKMKKIVIIGLITLLLIIACGKGNVPEEPFDPDFYAFLKEWDLSTFYYQNPCKSVKDAIDLGLQDKWSDIPDAIIGKISTCGLLETIRGSAHPQLFGPWPFSTNADRHGVTIFNNDLRANKVAVELFSRNDCFSVLASKFLTNIRRGLMYNDYFTMMLDSELSMETLNQREVIQTMAMAVERAEYIISSRGEYRSLNEIGQLMIVIMQSYHYAPFVEDIGVQLFETTWGYSFDWTDGFIGWDSTYVLKEHRFDLILTYATQF